MGHWWNDTDGETEVLYENLFPVPVCPQQILHGPGNTGLNSERLVTKTVWGMPRPRFALKDWLKYGMKN
jgi:hypothetical protein